MYGAAQIFHRALIAQALYIASFKNAEGISLTRSSAGMAANDGYLIDKSELQAGDLVFFDNDGNGTIDHVGIYMYDGYYIHSSSGIKDGVINKHTQ